MCGEYKNLFLLLDTNMGSPPHVWRILSCSSELFSALGITSTYVENTKPNTCHIDPHGDHLHIRGEYCCFIAFGFSPPGITSTYVENTHPGGYKTKKIILFGGIWVPSQNDFNKQFKITFLDDSGSPVGSEYFATGQQVIL